MHLQACIALSNSADSIKLDAHLTPELNYNVARLAAEYCHVRPLLADLSKHRAMILWHPR